MNMKKLIAIILVVILLVGVLAGCASSGNGPQGNSSPSVTPSESEQTDPTATEWNWLLSEEDKALVEAAFTGPWEEHVEDLEQGNYWYLGTYDGWIALYLTGYLHSGETDHYDWIDLVKDGQIYSLRECYQAGYITQEQYNQICDMYDAAEEADRNNNNS